MLELSPARKNKVNLADYNCQQDIENRMMMSDFSTIDIEVLEEILYSPLKISQKKLLRALSCEEHELTKSLNKLSSTGLVSVQGDTICVDKEKRKYFEFQIHRFDPQFKPDMEFVQGLLKKVPIHLLPTWYSIPRTSNNIFESIVERYLLTPHIFQRYLMELNFGEPILNDIMNDVLSAPDFKISSTDLISKYNLKRVDFEEILLILEFNFVCCLCYEKEDDHWLEYVSPFHEWKEYLQFYRDTQTPCIPSTDAIQRRSETDFAFLEKMSDLLLKAKKKALQVENSPEVQKLCLVKLAEYSDGKLKTLDAGDAWLDLSLENRALHLYRHPHNHILSLPVGERYVREAEKSIKRVLHGEWVYFDEFLKGVLVPLNENSVVMLKRVGKHWAYSLPVYGDEEIAILKATIFEWLYEMGMVATGTCNGRECFAMTHFGKFFFND
ncbi:MAG: hypothetical protein COT85_02290 [Chlamydiae bacterium CG10_big_fil_rev_8_21_14_0_10_42_34]|nr:MAG: hypothetical protein COT85_02290 [Chlamydiae bacterium CG10_big_fil_rev_8_21_14_0_10_42_34]